MSVPVSPRVSVNLYEEDEASQVSTNEALLETEKLPWEDAKSKRSSFPKSAFHATAIHLVLLFLLCMAWLALRHFYGHGHPYGVSLIDSVSAKEPHKLL